MSEESGWRLTVHSSQGLVEWNLRAPTDDAVAIFETLDAEYPRGEDGTWRIPQQDVAGVGAWIERCGGRQEPEKPAAEAMPLRICFTNGSVAVTTPHNNVTSPSGGGDCGYGVLMSGTATATNLSLGEIEGSSKAGHIVETLARLAAKLDEAMRKPLGEHEDEDQRTQKSQESAIELAGWGQRLYAALRLADTDAHEALRDSPRDQHVLVLSKDHCYLRTSGARTAALMRTHDLPFHLLSPDLPAPDGAAYGNLSRHVLGLRYALGVDTDFHPARKPADRPNVLLVGPSKDAGFAQVKALFDEQQGQFHVKLVNATHEFDTGRAGTSKEQWVPDIIHFQGHNQNQSLERDGGLGLSFEALERGLEACTNLGRRPTFCFLNTCESATNPLGATSSKSLAERVRDAGVSCIIATTAKVHEGRDGPAMNEFATYFYRQLLRGNTVGRALLEARRQDKDACGHTWWRYILIGDPTTRVTLPRKSDT